jgi:hypothetical protein
MPCDRFLGAVSEAGESGALMDTIRIRFDTWPGRSSPALEPVPPRA